MHRHRAPRALLVAAVALMLVGSTQLATHADVVRVPDLVGLTFGEARQTVDRSGLQLAPDSIDDRRPVRLLGVRAELTPP